MKYYAPHYYAEFRCIANACRHSCCIGWEIDIDAQTREKYRNVSGAMGKALAENIVEGDPAHFRLRADERCPFLCDDGLCRLILTLGEDSLCQICADHPRFRNFFSARTEIGLGLCCEAAAALIFGKKDRFHLLGMGEDGACVEALSAQEEEFFALRDALFAILASEAPLDVRMNQILAELGVSLGGRTLGEWCDIYLGLERLDAAWTERLLRLRSAEILPLPAWESEFSSLLAYFLYRHLAGALDEACFSADFAARAAFSVLSVQIIRALFAGGEQTLSELIEISRLYSSEIEYSEENLQTILDCLREGE